MAKNRPRKNLLKIDSLLVEIWILCFIPNYLLLVDSKGFTGISAFKTKLFYGFAYGLLPILTALLVLLILRLVKKRSVILKRRLQPLRPPTAAQFAALAFLLITLLSTLFSPFRARALYDETTHENLVTQCVYFLLFYVVSRWGRPTKRMLWFFLGAMVCLLGISLLQLADRNPFGIFPKGLTYHHEFVQENGPFLGTVGNVDLYSSLLSLAAPICLVTGVCLLIPGPQRERIGAGRIVPAVLALCLTAVCLYCMIQVRVLCGLVGLAAGGLLTAVILLPKTRRERLTALGILALLAVAAAVFFWFYTGSIRFFRELHQLLHGKVSDRFGSGRFYIWRQMLERLRSDPRHLLFGSGPDTVRYTGLEPFVRLDEAGQIVKKAQITDAHCLPLQILYCHGLFGLLAWLAALGFVLIPWIRAKERGAAEKALGAGLICFLVSMLFSFSSVIIMPFFWLTLGLLHGEQIERRNRNVQTP